MALRHKKPELCSWYSEYTTGWKVGGLSPIKVQRFFFLQNVENDSGAHPVRCLPRVNRPGRSADHTPPCGTHVKNECSYSSTPLICLYGADRDNLTEIERDANYRPKFCISILFTFQYYLSFLSEEVRVYGDVLS